MSAALADWHDFYALLGTAAATLIGAMFVVVSIGERYLTPERIAATRVFVTATVTHLSAALAVSLLTMAPGLGDAALGSLVGLGALAGLGYAGHILVVRIWRHEVDLADRFWYAALPFLGYAVLAAAGVALGLAQRRLGAYLLAGAAALLVLAAIRNSWDMIVFFATRRREP